MSTLVTGLEKQKGADGAGGSVKEKPILFSGPMVRAILENRKTQTRRVVKPPIPDIPGPISPMGGFKVLMFGKNGELVWKRECPYGQPGDRLWVKETFWIQNDTDCDEFGYGTRDCGSLLGCGEGHEIDYVATPECFNPPIPKERQTVKNYSGEATPGYWWLAPPEDWDGISENEHEERGEWIFLPWEPFTKHPSIHMPRWASRITLEITGVRAERLLDISEEDAITEGYESRAAFLAGEWASSKTQEFGNPWVWVVEFKRL